MYNVVQEKYFAPIGKKPWILLFGELETTKEELTPKISERDLGENPERNFPQPCCPIRTY